jgi:hypothetical protein
MHFVEALQRYKRFFVKMYANTIFRHFNKWFTNPDVAA